MEIFFIKEKRKFFQNPLFVSAIECESSEKILRKRLQNWSLDEYLTQNHRRKGSFRDKLNRALFVD